MIMPGRWRNLAVGAIISASALAISACSQGSDTPEDGKEAAAEILNVSYDPTRELYEEINPKFVAHWKQQTGQDMRINMSQGGAGQKARGGMGRGMWGERVWKWG